MKAIEVRAPRGAEVDRIVTPQALRFLQLLAREFEPRRKALLQRRTQVQQDIKRGAQPDFLTETREVRTRSWTVAPAPADLDDRRVEITGPVERKMMINALNSGARVFMADFEDALSPPWANVIAGQANCIDAVRRTLEYASPEGKRYQLGETLATLVVRPRGWHLEEKHLLVDGEPMSASLFDFGLYFFHNARELLDRRSGPYFYLPKLENHLEARLWNEVFVLSQEELGIPAGTIRATVLIETILAAFEMDEILYELRDHASGLNAGRWDYLFSIIKNFRDRPEFLLPDRAQLTMTVPFMRAYTELLVKTCHRRGAHAIGGMAAFIPSRRDPEVNATALARVREDKAREASAGYDGAWVAHPDLVPLVDEVFRGVLGARPHQKNRQRDDVQERREQLVDVRVPGGRVTEAGVRGNISVALQYLAAWLGGSGAVAINNLMEDAATAEIARSQL
ncbi:MAG: malate synthase A, partial [Gemmatimonadota bacterium]|nr:malate synthase A [Gemmatimonadota bacterium]